MPLRQAARATNVMARLVAKALSQDVSRRLRRRLNAGGAKKDERDADSNIVAVVGAAGE